MWAELKSTGKPEMKPLSFEDVAVNFTLDSGAFLIPPQTNSTKK
jgi:hypothetical protein